MMSGKFISRSSLYEHVESGLARNPIVALMGPRQVGKTSLGRLFIHRPGNSFDLESPIDLDRLSIEPFGMLDQLEGRVLIDEIQRMPQYFEYLRVLADRTIPKAQFILTGSQSPTIKRKISETLAGRIHLIEMGGFDTTEVTGAQWKSLWLRGGFPRSFAAETDEESWQWRVDFGKTYLMYDLERAANGGLSPPHLARLLAMMAHYHGQLWNRNAVATALGIDTKTVQKYVDTLVDSYLLRELPSFHANVGKRLRKAPRYFFRDSGLLHYLLGIREKSALLNHDRVGASFEGFGIEMVLRLLERDAMPYFWRTHAGSEIDLVVETSQGLFGIEFKSSTAPTPTLGSKVAMKDLGLERLFVVHAGDESRELAEGIVSVPMARLLEFFGTNRRGLRI